MKLLLFLFLSLICIFSEYFLKLACMKICVSKSYLQHRTQNLWTVNGREWLILKKWLFKVLRILLDKCVQDAERIIDVFKHKKKSALFGWILFWTSLQDADTRALTASFQTLPSTGMVCVLLAITSPKTECWWWLQKWAYMTQSPRIFCRR